MLDVSLHITALTSSDLADRNLSSLEEFAGLPAKERVSQSRHLGTNSGGRGMINKPIMEDRLAFRADAIHQCDIRLRNTVSQ